MRSISVFVVIYGAHVKLSRFKNLDIEHNFPPFGIWDEVAIVSASFCPP